MDLICRAHQVVVDGFEFFNDRDLVTVFSAPDYCGEFDNRASVMIVEDNMKCCFKYLQPLKRLRNESPQMSKLFIECDRFEDLFPFKKLSVAQYKEVMNQKVASEFISLKYLQ